MSSALLRRSAVAEVGGIPPGVEVVPDYFLFAGVARRYRARAVQQVVCRYRMHAGSLSHTGLRGMQQESLQLVAQWAPALGVPLARERTRVHSTVLAVNEMMHVTTAASGMRRLLREGSPGFVLSRPFSWAMQAARRRVITPRWQGEGEARARPDHVDGSHADVTGGFLRTLSIVIVNWNVRDLLRSCLHSVKAHTELSSGEYEIVVVDNASSDGSVRMLAQEFPDVHVIANHENVGFGRANNQALATCHGRYLLLLNPDTIVLSGTIDRMLALAESRPDIGALGCRLQHADGGFQQWAGGSRPTLATIACHYLLLNRILPAAMLPPPLYLEREPADDADVGWVSGACMLLRRDALRGRLFDDRFFMYCEDLELCQRLIQGGWSVVYTPRCAVVHYEGRSLAQQAPEMALHRPHSLRALFAMYNPAQALRRYDLLAWLGFLVRTFAFGVATLVHPNRQYAERAAMSRLFLADAWRTLRRR